MFAHNFCFAEMNSCYFLGFFFFLMNQVGIEFDNCLAPVEVPVVEPRPLGEVG